MKYFRQIVQFGIAVSLSFIILELFIRNSFIGNVSNTDFYEDIGRGRRRNLNFVYFNEGFGIGKFNKFRFIGKTHFPLNKVESIRVACIGDSYIEAFQIFERDYFGNIAELELSKEFPNYDIEFLNFGRSGFDIGDFYAYHKLFVRNFEPDYILYFISNSDVIPKYTDSLCPKTILKDDSLSISLDFPKSELKKYKYYKYFIQNSSILNMLNSCRKKAKIVPIGSIVFDKIYWWINPKKNEENENISELHSLPVSIITSKIIHKLDSTNVIFVNKSMDKLSPDIQRLIIQNGFNYIDLSEPLNDYKNSGKDPNMWRATEKLGHWNREGHRVVGLKLAEALKNILPPEKVK